MKKSLLAVIDIKPSGASSGAYTLVLEEVNGQRKLPIVIGMHEAQSIAIKLENMTPSRPLTHDLLQSVATSFGVAFGFAFGFGSGALPLALAFALGSVLCVFFVAYSISSFFLAAS